jgi:hypothetical protein
MVEVQEVEPEGEPYAAGYILNAAILRSFGN